MNLFFDANISFRILKIVRNDFPLCSHVSESGLISPATDLAIWNHAKKNNLVIVTHDEDFGQLLLLKGFPPKVVRIRTGNLTTLQTANLLINRREIIKSFIEDNQSGLLEIF